MVMRVKDEGESERRRVTGRIRTEEQLPNSDIDRRESEQTSLGSFQTKELEKATKEAIADDGG